MINSAEEFIRLRQSEIAEEYHRAANDSALLSVWYKVIEKYPDYKSWVVHNKTVPIEILEHLVDDPDDDVRMTIAMKRKAGDSILLKLAKDKEFFVRKNVVHNAKASIEVLRILANDPSEEIAKIAKNRIEKIVTTP